jgi:hypothetical protein
MKYAKYFNQKRGTNGHVFQGRPGMKIVLDNSYLLKMVGYIHLNSVEAGMVTAVDQFEWSSWNWFLEGEKGDLARSCYPSGFDGKDRENVFRDVSKVFDCYFFTYCGGTFADFQNELSGPNSRKSLGKESEPR